MNRWIEGLRINSFQLKMIAIVTMLVDHTGRVLFPQYLIMQEIGRVSFPIFCFLLVEGFYHTKNIKQYMMRCLILGVVSEVPFDLALKEGLWDWSRQNVGFTLLLGLVVMWLVEERRNQMYVQGNHSLWWIYGSPISVFLIIWLADYVHVDYGATGIFIILIFYVFRNHFLWQTGAMGVLNMWIMKGIQGYAVFAMLPIGLYNGKRGWRAKYVFYIFYPLHLLILWCIKCRLGDI